MSNFENEFAVSHRRSNAEHNQESKTTSRGISPPVFQLKPSVTDQSDMISSFQNKQPNSQNDQSETEESGLQMKKTEEKSIANGSGDDSPNDSGEMPNEIPAGVNIHKNSSKATQLKAKAFAKGNDIHFAPGEFKPGTNEGDKLIGHELKHVEQQAQGKVKPTTQLKGEKINDDSDLEREADEAGQKFASGNWTPQNLGGGNATQLKSRRKTNGHKKRYINDVVPTMNVSIYGWRFLFPPNVYAHPSEDINTQIVKALLRAAIGEKQMDKVNLADISGLINVSYKQTNESFPGFKLGPDMGPKLLEFFKTKKISPNLDQEEILTVYLSRTAKNLYKGLNQSHVSETEFLDEMSSKKNQLMDLDYMKKNKSKNLKNAEFDLKADAVKNVEIAQGF